MTGWTPSTDEGKSSGYRPNQVPSPFPMQPGIQHHANPPTCTVESCPFLPAPCPFLPYVIPVSLLVSCPPPGYHARPRVSCPPPICHSRESGNPESFPHPPPAGEGAAVGRASLALPLAKLRESAGVRVKERSSPLSCDNVGFLLPSASHTLKTLRMSETLWVVGVAQG